MILLDSNIGRASVAVECLLLNTWMLQHGSVSVGQNEINGGMKMISFF